MQYGSGDNVKPFNKTIKRALLQQPNAMSMAELNLL